MVSFRLLTFDPTEHPWPQASASAAGRRVAGRGGRLAAAPESGAAEAAGRWPGGCEAGRSRRCLGDFLG